jgi:hypothetical protein
MHDDGLDFISALTALLGWKIDIISTYLRGQSWVALW